MGWHPAKGKEKRTERSLDAPTHTNNSRGSAPTISFQQYHSPAAPEPEIRRGRFLSLKLERHHFDCFSLELR